MAVYPQQFIPQSEKNEEWLIKSIDFFIEDCSWDNGKKELYKKIYDAINGDIPVTEYQYVTNPINSEVYKFRGLPSRIRNYNILRPAIMLLLGEFIRRPKNYVAVNTNPEVFDHVREQEMQRNITNIFQSFINQLNEMGVDTGVPSKRMQSLQSLLEDDQSFAERLQEVANETVELMWQEADLDEEIIEAFYHYLCVGEVYSYATVVNDKTHYETVNPLDIGYSKSGSNRYIKDGNAVYRRKYMQVNEVLDLFQDMTILDEGVTWDDIQQHLDDNGVGIHGQWFSFFTGELVNGEEESDRQLLVEHVQWRAYRKVGILLTSDPISGEVVTLEVDESYKLDKDNGDIELRWEWQDEIREGYRIDERYHLGGDILLHTDGCFEYDGMKQEETHVPWAVGTQGYAYQLLYNILHYRGEIAIAKHKGNIVMMPYELAPDGEEFGMDEFFYHIDALNFGFYEATGEGKEKLMAVDRIKAVNLSMDNYIRNHYDLLQMVTTEFEMSIGITPQRKGDIRPSEKVTNVNAATNYSATINEEIFYRFERFWEKQLNRMVGMSKYAWREGKRRVYVNNEYRIKVFELLPEDLTLMDIGVFIKQSGEEARKLETLRSFGMSFAQNVGKPGITASLIADLIEGSNFAKIKRQLKETEKTLLEMERQAAENAERINQQNVQMQTQLKQQESQQKAMEQERSRMHESVENEKDRIHQKELEQMKTGVQYASIDANRDGIADKDQAADMVRAQNERQSVHLQREANQIKREEIAYKERDSKRKVQIAKENKNRHDK